MSLATSLCFKKIDRYLKFKRISFCFQLKYNMIKKKKNGDLHNCIPVPT